MTSPELRDDQPRVGRRAVSELLDVLEDRRLLFGERHLEDEQHTLFSSIEIRKELTAIKQRNRPTAGASAAIDEIRSACRAFANAGGANARNFHSNDRKGVKQYEAASAELRIRVGKQLFNLTKEPDVRVSPELYETIRAAADTEN